MPDVVQQVTTQSYGGRLINSFTGIIFGFILFIASFGVLWTNEGNYVKTAQGLSEGRDSVVELNGTNIEQDNNNKLVHVAGRTTVGEAPLKDSTFGIQSNALLLERKVEMYQWNEEKESKSRESVGGSETTTTTYTYKKDWSSDVISSAEFNEQAGHENPGTFPYPPEKQFASDAKLGEFQLRESVIDKIGNASSVPVTTFVPESVPGTKVNGQYIYVGENPATPQVGDTRISFSAVLPGEVSVVGKQNGSTLGTYTAKSGSPILLVSSGTKSANELFTAAEESNSNLTWLFRGAGLVLMWLGIMLIFKPLSMIFAFIPFLRGLVQGVVAIAAAAVTLVLGGLTIAIAWLFFRPLVSLAIIVVAVGLAFLIKKTLFKKKDGTTPAV